MNNHSPVTSRPKKEPLRSHSQMTVSGSTVASDASAAASSGTRTLPLPHFQHLLAGLQVRWGVLPKLSPKLHRKRGGIHLSHLLWCRVCKRNISTPQFTPAQHAGCRCMVLLCVCLFLHDFLCTVYVSVYVCMIVFNVVSYDLFHHAIEATLFLSLAAYTTQSRCTLHCK